MRVVISNVIMSILIVKVSIRYHTLKRHIEEPIGSKFQTLIQVSPRIDKTAFKASHEEHGRTDGAYVH